MIKAIVVARDYSQFAMYLRNKRLLREEYGYYVVGHPEKCYGLDREKTKVYWLEGWSENEKMSTHDVNYLRSVYVNHTTVPEGWIYNEGFSF